MNKNINKASSPLYLLVCIFQYQLAFLIILFNELHFITVSNHFDVQIFPNLTGGCPFKQASVTFSYGPLSDFLT